MASPFLGGLVSRVLAESVVTPAMKLGKEYLHKASKNFCLRLSFDRHAIGKENMKVRMKVQSSKANQSAAQNLPIPYGDLFFSCLFYYDP